MESMVVAVIFFLLGSFSSANSSSTSGLSVNFYSKTCPKMEEKVKEVMAAKMKAGESITAPSTLRLFFHDCFVQGCDGSVLISSTKEKKAERDANINLSLAGDAFDAVIRSKNALEEICPGVVSCADILAVLAREAVAITNGPWWEVAKGRRDSRVSSAAAAAAELPESSSNLTQLINRFQSKGLDPIDLATLSGAHSLGSSHCGEFSERLTRRDTTMDPAFLAALLQSCPLPIPDKNVVVTFDSSPFVFDNSYFKDLVARRGLLTSDQVLFSGNGPVQEAVSRYAENQTWFFLSFASAMKKFGEVGILSGREGEVRKDCTKIN